MIRTDFRQLVHRVMHRSTLAGMEDRALRRGNAWLATIHAAQAAAILVLSTGFALPVTGAFMEGPPGHGLPQQALLFNLRIGPLVGAFLLLAGLRLPPRLARVRRGDRVRWPEVPALGGTRSVSEDVKSCEPEDPQDLRGNTLDSKPPAKPASQLAKAAVAPARR